MRVKDGEFHQVGRIEHHVRILLVRIDPLLLRATHVGPLVDGLAGRERALVVVAHDAAQQAVVAGRHPVVVVQRDARERGDEDLEGARRGDLRDQLRIEGVDAFDQQHAARLHLQVLAVVFAASRDEVEFRHIDHFPVQQPEHVLLQGAVVHGLEIVEVVASVGEFRGLDAVDEIVVGRERNRLEAAGLELHAQAVRDRGLAAARRTGDQHDADRILRVVVAALDLLRNLDELLLLQGLGDLDQVGCTALQANVVHVARVAQIHDAVPLEVLGKDLEGLGLVDERRQDLGIRAVRHAQQQAAVIRNHVPDPDIACRRQQAAVVIVHRVAQHIVVHVGLTAGFQQTDLVLVSLLTEDLDGLFQPHLAAVERQVLVNDLLHPFLETVDVLLRHRFPVGLAQFAEIAVGDGVLDLHLRFRPDVQGGLAEQEAQRPAVDAAGAGVAQVEELDVAVVVHAEAQALRHVVDLGRDDRVRAVEFKFRQHFLERRPFVEMFVGTGVLAVDLEHG